MVSAVAVLLALFLAPRTSSGQEVHGFVEGLNGVRTTSGSGFEEGTYTARETRLQLRLSGFSDVAEYFARADFLFDPIAASTAEVVLREAHFTYTGLGFMDFKAGRQILTWGTGDLLFINDVFPRSWESFFVGRDLQYLKEPTDGARFSFYPSTSNIELVLLPRFQPDVFPTSDRMSFYNPLGDNFDPQEPTLKVDNGELALRAYRNVGSFELALYGYTGFFRAPVGFDPQAMQAFYPALNVYGASLRRGLWGGVANGEYGYYDSRQDRDGTNPFIENSSSRWMIGYDRQVWTDFQIGLQGYWEYIDNHEGYKAGLQPGEYVRDQVRHLYTARLTQWLKYQTLRLSLFGYVSPTDEDYYVRALASYKLSDPLEIALGANLFGGAHQETLFGQFADNDNVFVRGRYSF
jgi:hypothetical protein